MAFRLLLALAQTGLLVFIASSMFKVQMLGSWSQLIGMVALGALCLISIGYLVASFIKTPEVAMPVLQLGQFQIMSLSGIFFPLDMMPSFMRPIQSAMPLTYLGDALRQIMVQGTPAHTLTLEAAVLGATMAVCLVLSPVSSAGNGRNRSYPLLPR
jgi:ABC-2 type transport system permease protein